MFPDVSCLQAVIIEGLRSQPEWTWSGNATRCSSRAGSTRWASNSTAAVWSRWSSEREANLQLEARVGRARLGAKQSAKTSVLTERASVSLLPATVQRVGRPTKLCTRHKLPHVCRRYTQMDSFRPKLHDTASAGRPSERTLQVSALDEREPL